MSDKRNITGSRRASAEFAVDWRVFVRGVACLNLLITGFLIAGIIALIAGIFLLSGIFSATAPAVGIGIFFCAACLSVYAIVSYLGIGIVEGRVGRTLSVLVFTSLPLMHLSGIISSKTVPRRPSTQTQDASVTPATVMVGQLSQSADFGFAVAITFALFRRKEIGF